MVAELIIADQRAIRLAAEDSVLGFIDFLEQPALIELRRLFEVLEQVLLRGVEYADFERGAA